MSGVSEGVTAVAQHQRQRGSRPGVAVPDQPAQVEQPPVRRPLKISPAASDGMAWKVLIPPRSATALTLSSGLAAGVGTVVTEYRPPLAAVSRTRSPVISVTVYDRPRSPGSVTSLAGAAPGRRAAVVTARPASGAAGRAAALFAVSAQSRRVSRPR